MMGLPGVIAAPEGLLIAVRGSDSGCLDDLDYVPLPHDLLSLLDFRDRCAGSSIEVEASWVVVDRHIAEPHVDEFETLRQRDCADLQFSTKSRLALLHWLPRLLAERLAR